MLWPGSAFPIDLNALLAMHGMRPRADTSSLDILLIVEVPSYTRLVSDEDGSRQFSIGRTSGVTCAMAMVY